MVGKTKCCPYFQNSQFSLVYDLQNIPQKEEKTTANLPLDSRLFFQQNLIKFKYILVFIFHVSIYTHIYTHPVYT